jgi:biotin operon repressor
MAAHLACACAATSSGNRKNSSGRDGLRRGFLICSDGAGRDRALIALAINGPMRIRELGRAIGSDSHKTWDMIEHLRDAGIVVKRDRTGGRKYAALNRGLPTYPRLLRLLLALDERWPAKRIEQTRYRRGMPNDALLSDAGLDHIFQSPVTDMTTLCGSLGLGGVSALYAVNHWEREGMVRSRNAGPASPRQARLGFRRRQRTARLPHRGRPEQPGVQGPRGRGASAYRTPACTMTAQGGASQRARMGSRP